MRDRRRKGGMEEGQREEGREGWREGQKEEGREGEWGKTCSLKRRHVRNI